MAGPPGFEPGSYGLEGAAARSAGILLSICKIFKLYAVSLHCGSGASL